MESSIIGFVLSLAILVLLVYRCKTGHSAEWQSIIVAWIMAAAMWGTEIISDYKNRKACEGIHGTFTVHDDEERITFDPKDEEAGEKLRELINGEGEELKESQEVNDENILQ